MSNKNTGTPWFVSGDLNGYFGLFSNVLTNFLAAIGLLVFAINMPTDMVYGSIVPATAISIGLGGIYLAYMARRNSIKAGRDDMTAMPYGLSVPHYFAVAFGVLLPAYLITNDWAVAWAVGIAWNMVQGIIMLIGAFVGPFIQKYIPRAALLGSLAGLAATYIAMNPIGQVYNKPYIGLVCFVIVVAGWLAHKKMPFNMPAGLMAIIVGMILAWVTGAMSFSAVKEAAAGFELAIPMFELGNIAKGFELLSPYLPAAIPLAIYNFLESLDNVESASAEGDHYSTMETLAVPAVATLIGSLFGSVFPTIVYIGHPGWKKAGARVGYSMATGISVLIISFFGLLPLVLSVVPLVALLPILVYIAMVIGAQAFGETKPRHIPALIFAFLPFIASFVVLQINNALGAAGTSAQEVGYEALASAGVQFEGWQRLGSSDILVSMLLATIVIFLIDRKYKLSAAYAGIAGVLSFFGLIHVGELGWAVGTEMAIGYGAMALALLAVAYYRSNENQPIEDESHS